MKSIAQLVSENAQLRSGATALIAEVKARCGSDTEPFPRLAAALSSAPTLDLAQIKRALEPFARWCFVMDALLERDRQRGIIRQGGWEDVDVVLSGLGQVVTRGHFKRASAALASLQEVIQ